MVLNLLVLHSSLFWVLGSKQSYVPYTWNIILTYEMEFCLPLQNSNYTRIKNNKSPKTSFPKEELWRTFPVEIMKSSCKVGKRFNQSISVLLEPYWPLIYIQLHIGKITSIYMRIMKQECFKGGTRIGNLEINLVTSEVIADLASAASAKILPLTIKLTPKLRTAKPEISYIKAERQR